mgnify:CR=1 FL=1
MKNYNKYMDTQASRERKFTQTMEKWIMYFMYALFGGLFLLISLSGSFSEGLILLPIAVVSIPLTKWVCAGKMRDILEVHKIRTI